MKKQISLATLRTLPCNCPAGSPAQTKVDWGVKRGGHTDWCKRRQGQEAEELIEREREK
jgi:hypothetical protein